MYIYTSGLVGAGKGAEVMVVVMMVPPLGLSLHSPDIITFIFLVFIRDIVVET